jgi:NAD-dependent DNA ligase
MLSEKATRILRRIGSFTEEQLDGMSEAEAWHHIYAHDQAKAETGKARNPEVCFTGFTDDQKAVLTESAIQAGFIVKDSVTKNLRVLVAGSNAGPSKLAKAEAQDCIITDATEFLAYLEMWKATTENR